MCPAHVAKSHFTDIAVSGRFPYSYAYRATQTAMKKPPAMILDVLTSGDPGGMTADEIGEKLVSEGKIPTNSPNFTRPRLTEMKAEGKVVIVGRRLGKSGCNTAVWKVKR